jgi:GxxExxY protein
MNTKLHESKILHKELSYIIQGCCFEIRKEYGAGQKESVYVNLLQECLESKGLTVEKEKSIKIYSFKTGKVVGTYRPDLIVNQAIPIEVKSSRFTTKQDEKQLYHYLRNSNYELGYLVNFSTRKLFMKRIIYTNDKKPFLKLLSCIFAFCFVLFSVNTANAAILNLVSQIKEIGINQQFQVDVILNTEGEQINAVEGTVLFPDDILKLENLNEANSILTFWPEKPRIYDGNKIKFAGITPGGYQEEKGLLFSITFQAKKEGAGLIEIKDSRVLLNDSQGTPTNVKTFDLQFSISKEAPISQTQISEIKDTEPPEDFKPEIARNPEMFEGKYFLVFATQDKKSGIDYYAVYESRRKRTQINEKDWQIVESPYVLKDQKLKSYIYVKAVDKAGNERIAVVEPRYPLKWYENWWVWVIIVIILAYIWRKLKIKNEKRKITI